jgi:signal transduction histidine kinase
MGVRLNYSGLVVAGIGFFLTRFTVTLAIYEDPVRFYLTGVLPLVLGLGLSAFGVALVVADVDRSLVRTTALWCVAGAGAMLVLVVLTLSGSTTDDMPAFATGASRTYLSNFLIGGSVGGTLTGLYAARNRRQRRRLREQANRLDVLHRLLRHEILNSLTAIRGYAALDDDGGRAQEVIETRSEAIEETIEAVKHLTGSTGTNQVSVAPVDVADPIEASVQTIERRHSDATVSVGLIPENLTAVADERLERIVVNLLENAIVHGDEADPVGVSVTATPSTVRIGVSDTGPGLPEREQRLLETGEIDRFDDPGTGFGLNVVRFLVENYRGAIETDVDADGTTITIELPRGPDADAGPGTGPRLGTGLSGEVGVRRAVPHLAVAFAAAVIAGVFYGLSAEATGGSIGIIGVLYGVESAVVGWITHEFHSVVFGFVFLGMVSQLPARYSTHLPAYVAVGTAWGLVLWLFVAGVVSPIWLRFVGIPAPIPNLSVVTLVSHLVWGVSIGVLTWLGFEHVSPRMSGFADR